MSCYLYGFIEAKEEKSFGKIGFDLEAGEKGTVVALPGDQNVGAVIGKTEVGNFKEQSKEDIIQLLLSHQETLETIMKTQFILPCKFGTVLKDEAEAQGILSQNASFLNGLLKKMKNRLEMDVLATWVVPDVLKEIAAIDPEVAKLKMDFQSLSLADQEKNKVALGVCLQTKLHQKAKECAKQILNQLQAKAASYAIHDVMNDAMICNASFLIDQGDRDSFFKALDDLDKHFEGKLHFKCVGPLPPHSFATIQVKRFDPEQILKASQTLGLNGSADLKKVKQAYKLKAQQCHPDTHPEFSQKEFEHIHQAYKILMDYYQGGSKPIQLSLLDASKELR